MQPGTRMPITTPHVHIVTTVREPGPPLLSFIAYHQSLGFEHIFVFFDQQADPWFDRVADLPGVTAVPCDESLLALRRRRCRVLNQVEDYLDKEVMARQILNVDLALQFAHERGADWLLHVDIDELFFSNTSAQEHFALLPSTIGQVTYVNYEAFPECADTNDYFRSVTLFKMNRQNLPDHLVADWLAATGREWYFLAYANGKSAVRVSPDVLPAGVHSFDIASTRLESVVSTNPLILHYANCGLDYFVRKYRHRGKFSNSCFDRWPRAAFQALARDVIGTGDERLILEFYDRHVLCRNEAEAADLIRFGLGARITGPRNILTGLLGEEPLCAGT